MMIRRKLALGNQIRTPQRVFASRPAAHRVARIALEQTEKSELTENFERLTRALPRCLDQLLNLPGGRHSVALCEKGDACEQSSPAGCPRDAAHARSDEGLERPRRAHRPRCGISPVGHRLHRCAGRRMVPQKADRRCSQSARHPRAPFQQTRIAQRWGSSRDVDTLPEPTGRDMANAGDTE
jgi:hypothetical protein